MTGTQILYSRTNRNEHLEQIDPTNSRQFSSCIPGKVTIVVNTSVLELLDEGITSVTIVVIGVNGVGKVS